MIACIYKSLNCVGYLCMLGRRCHISFLIAGLISSCTSSTLGPDPASQGFTFGNLGVSGLDGDGSVGFVMVALEKTSESCLIEVMLLSLRVS